MRICRATEITLTENKILYDKKTKNNIKFPEMEKMNVDNDEYPVHE